MKSLRNLVLMLAVAAVSFSATQAFSQQEVDPDHYDQPIAAKAPVHKVASQRHAYGKSNVASKRAKQHHSRVTA